MRLENGLARAAASFFAVGALLVAALPGHGAVRAAEDFNYPDGGLGSSRGVGWRGSWASNSVVANGAAQTASSTAIRGLTEPIVPAEGVVVYVGLELGADSSAENDFAGFSFYSGEDERLFIGMAFGLDSYGLNITGFANEGSSVPVTTVRQFIVGEFLFHGETEVTVNVYVTPGRTLGEPVATYTGGFLGGPLDGVRLASSDAASYDNLVIGDQLVDVLGPLATDDFSYADGPLLGEGGEGWAGAWTGLTSVTDGVAMSAGLTNSAFLWGFRDLAEPIVPEAGKTIYLGFEMGADSNLGDDFAGVSFYSGDQERLFAGMPFDTDSYGLNIAGVANIGSSIPVGPARRYVVAEIIFLSTSELTVNVYIDPWLQLGAPDATFTGGFVQEGAWDSVRLASGGASDTVAWFDHLVISERLYDVLGASPIIFSNGAVHAASFVEGAIAPGQIVSIFGAELGPGAGVGATLDSRGRVAGDAGGVRVLFDGVPGAVFFAGPGQINVQAPYSLDGKSVTDIQVRVRGRPSQTQRISTVPSNPGIFTVGGGGQPIVINATRGGFVSVSNPARPGDIVTLYVTGGGQTTPPGVDGELAMAPYPTPVLPVRVTIGGADAEILYAGRAPGFAGLIQINARVGNLTGLDLELLVVVGANASQPALTLAVIAQ